MLLNPTSHVAAMEASTCTSVVEAEAAADAKPSCKVLNETLFNYTHASR